MMQKLIPAAIAMFAVHCAVAETIGPDTTLVTNTEPFTVNTPTTFDASVRAYTYTSGYGAINADLSLTNQAYLRLVGSTSKTPERGVYIATNAAADITISISGKSGLYATYRNSITPTGWVARGIDPNNKDQVKSYVWFRLGIPGGAVDSTGRAKFVLADSTDYSVTTIGENIRQRSLWAQQMSIETSVPANETGYIDFMRLDKNGCADLGTLYQNNTTHPVRILFNGGQWRFNYACKTESILMKPVQGSVIVCEGINGNDVIIQKEYGNGSLNGGSGTVRFQGTCNVRLRESGATWGTNRMTWPIQSSNPVEWKNTGSLIVDTYSILLTKSDNVLPYKADEPDIRLGDSAILDLNGCTENVRSLVGTSATLVTNISNSAVTTSKLVFGADNTDGIFGATCCAGVNVEKIGTGTLIISNATVTETLSIKAGTVKFVGKNSIAHVEVADGVTVLSEEELTADAIKHVVNPLSDLGVRCCYEKTTAGETLLYADGVLDGGTLKVQSGSVRFTGTSTDKWWRLVMLGAVKAWTNTCVASTAVELNEFTLYPSNIVTWTGKSAKMLNYGLVTNTSGTAWTSYAQMTPGTCTEGFGEWYHWDISSAQGRQWWGPNALCVAGGRYVFWTEGKIAVSESAPRHVIYRLKDDAPAVSSYTLCATQWSWGSLLKKWRVESSADGETWTVRDEHEAQWADTSACANLAEQRATSELPSFECGVNGYYNNGVPYRFTKGASAAETLQNVHAEVAAGAVLDTTYVNDDALSFAELTVDCAAGAGTITKFSPAANGKITLTNLSLAAGEKRALVTVNSVVNAANLDTWQIYINGQLRTDCKLLVVDQKLCVHLPGGLILIVK